MFFVLFVFWYKESPLFSLSPTEIVSLASPGPHYTSTATANSFTKPPPSPLKEDMTSPLSDLSSRRVSPFFFFLFDFMFLYLFYGS